jgi:phage terminase small subunit
MGISKKQIAFCHEYVKDFNATQAAIRAGYAPRAARQQASRLLTKANVSGYLDDLIKSLKMSPDEVLIRLAEMARGVGSEYFDEDGNFNFLKAKDDDKMHLVHSVSRTDGEKSSSLRVEIYDAETALINIARHHRLLSDQNISLTLNVEGLEDLLERIYNPPQSDDQG